jgi:hypothetical protein
MNKLNTVPWWLGLSLLRTFIRPSGFWMMPSVTQKPRPVPVMPLVEKTGSKMRASVALDMPWPLVSHGDAHVLATGAPNTVLSQMHAAIR